MCPCGSALPYYPAGCRPVRGFSVKIKDRLTYPRLVQENLDEAGVRILGYCLMSNHVRLIAVTAREDSLSILARRVHGRYAQYYNARSGRSGHLWQNRFFACMSKRWSKK